MSVNPLDAIDIMSTDPQGYLALTINEHLDCSNSVEHLTILQAKLDRHLAFIESGEILQRYPDAKGRPFAIPVFLKHRPDREALAFLTTAKAVLDRVGFEFRQRILAESPMLTGG